MKFDDWHTDETVVFINGERYYLWIATDSETRFVLAFHLTKSKGEDSAFTLYTLLYLSVSLNISNNCSFPTFTKFQIFFSR